MEDILAMFHKNLSGLRSLLIRLKQGKPQKNKSARVFCNLIVPRKVVVNVVVPTAN